MKGFIICKGDKTKIEGVPEIVKLLPIGHIQSQKGDFDVDSESFAEMKRNFEGRGIDIVIDYEHQTLKDMQAPAGGWIKELILQADAIAAQVEWTPAAKKYLENKEYKYLSPVVLVRKRDNKATALHSVALTNSPAIDGMFPIVNSLTYEGEKLTMDFIELAELLGLPDGASEDEIKQAISTALSEANTLKEKAAQTGKNGSEAEKVVANKAVCELLDLKAGALTEDVTAKIMELKAGHNSGFDSESEIKTLKSKLADRDADDVILKAFKAGKISAAQKAWAKSYALKDPAGFASFVENAPQVVPMGEVSFDEKVLKDEKPTSETMLVCKQLGISEEDLRKYGGAQ